LYFNYITKICKNTENRNFYNDFSVKPNIFDASAYTSFTGSCIVVYLYEEATGFVTIAA